VKKHNVLYLNHIGRISGAEIVQMRLVEQLADTNIHRVGMCPDDGELYPRYKQVMDVVEPLPMTSNDAGWLSKARDYAASMAAVRWAVRRHKIDLIHANTFRSALIAAPVGRLMGVPVIWHMHDILKKKLRNSMLVWLYSRLVQAIVCVSDATAQGLLRLGAQPEKVQKIYNGVPLSELEAKAASADDVLGKYNGRGPAVVMVGQITPWKGQDVLLNAMPGILQKSPKTHFFFVGDGMQNADRQYKADLQRQTQANGLDEHVTWLGFRDDVPGIMRQADVIVHCSVYPDPLPTVVLEGMALEKVLVASHIGGVAEMVADQETGYLFSPGDSQNLADKVIEVLENPETRTQMGRRAGQRIRSLFSMETNVQAIQALYRNVLSAPVPWQKRHLHQEAGRL